MKSFLQERIRLVRSLWGRKCELGVCYGDVALITCAVLGACASQRWPGRGNDRKRFVELLVNHSPCSFHTSWVSTPMLINAGLLREGQTACRGGNATRIYCGCEIDSSFDQAETTFTDIEQADLKRHCYAYLMYKYLRCSYVHEYSAHENVTTVPASQSQKRVSYIRRCTTSGSMLMMSFGLDYLLSLAEHHVANLPPSPDRPPDKWWLLDL
jgi:hypothetical protein